MDTSGARGILDELFSLEGKVAIVTGAAGGIGRVLARGFARAGARVALADINFDMAAEIARGICAEIGGPAESAARSYSLDLAEEASVNAAAADVFRDFGRIDILVNSAAINRRQPILEVESSTYDQIMAVDLRGLFLLSKAVAPAMIRQGGGKIVHIGSINSESGLAGVSVYGAAKGAIKQLTRVMAVEWASKNIQVNCLAPGFIRTELSAPLWADEAKRQWMEGRIAMGRPGEPEELLGIAIYLASPASSFTTGQTFLIDGGFCAGGKPW